MAPTISRSFGRRFARVIATRALAVSALLCAADAHATALDTADAMNSSPSKKKSSGKKGKKKGKKSSKSKTDAGKTDAGKADASKADAGKVDAAKPEPSVVGLTLDEPPLKAKGKVPGSTQGRLLGRLEAALAGVKVEGEYRVRLTVAISKKNKKNYTLTLSATSADGKAQTKVSEPCKKCSVSQAGDAVAALVPQLVTAIEELAKAPGEVSVAAVPPGATVSVDGKEQGPAPQVLELSPGAHEVKVAKEGFVEQVQTVEVEPRSEQKLDFTLEEVPPPQVVAPLEGGKKDEGKGEEPAPAPAGPKAGKPWTIAGGVVLGLGLAGVATGVALVLIDESAIPSKCKGAQVDFRGVCRVRYDTLTGGIIGIAAGAVGIGGGIALMVRGRQVTLKARGGKSSASFRVQVRF